MKKGLPIEGVSMEEARAIKANVTVPVLNTGGYQTASFIRNGLNSGAFDGVAIARSLTTTSCSNGPWAAICPSGRAPIATNVCSTPPRIPWAATSSFGSRAETP